MINIMEKNLTQHKDIKLSFKFGFLGLGMGGSSIAAKAADVKTATSFPYKALLINSTQMDSEKIRVENDRTVKLVIGDGRGASRNIERGETIFTENVNQIQEAINTNFEDRDFIWIVAGLGGGTGTGSLIQAIRLLMINGFNGRFGIIITLPRNSEGKQAINNALERLEEINNAMHGLGSVIIVDNQKLFEQYVKDQGKQTTKQYLEYTNKYIADSLHALNVVTATYEPFSEFHFDVSEFGTLIRTPGVFQLVRFSIAPPKIDNKKPIDLLDFIRSNINKGVLSDGYNLAESKRFALSILANHLHSNKIFNMELTTQIEDLFKEIAPLCDEQAIGQYNYDLEEDTSDIFFYAAFSGLSLPKRIGELIEESQRIEKAQQEALAENNTVDPFSNFSVKQRKTPTTKQDGAVAFEDLFGTKKPATDISDNENAYNKLFNK